MRDLSEFCQNIWRSQRPVSDKTTSRPDGRIIHCQHVRRAIPCISIHGVLIGCIWYSADYGKGVPRHCEAEPLELIEGIPSGDGRRGGDAPGVGMEDD